MAGLNETTLVLSDYKDILRKLNKLEPGLASALKRNLKEIAEIPRKAVRAEIPSRPPIRGMKRVLSPVGKTWNTRGQARAVTIQTATKAQRPTLREKPIGIVKLVISSPATIIADMAGRGNFKSSIDGQKTDWYVYPRAKGTTENTRPNLRRHRVNGQGRAMVRALGSEPSRFVYPAVEETMPEVTERVGDLMDFVIGEIERDLNG